MKFLLIFTLLLLFSFSFNIHTQNESKRPSWSQGLPERPSANQPGKPGFKAEPSQSSLSTEPDVPAERPTTPILDIELSTQPDLTFKLDKVEPQKDIASSRRGLAHFQSRDFIEKEDNPLHAQ